MASHQSSGVSGLQVELELRDERSQRGKSDYTQPTRVCRTDGILLAAMEAFARAGWHCAV